MISMKNKIKISKLKLYLTALLLLLISAVISSSCTCPIFSLIENLTGVQVKAGKNIDEALIEKELIYPDSTALVQAEGNVNTIMEMVSRYGAVLSEKDMAVFNELPQEIKEQEVSATIYSTTDSKEEVLEYYTSGGNQWDIVVMEDPEQTDSKEQPTIVVASKDDTRQALVLAGTENNTFIIFLGFDWEALSEVRQ